MATGPGDLCCAMAHFAEDEESTPRASRHAVSPEGNLKITIALR